VQVIITENPVVPCGRSDGEKISVVVINRSKLAGDDTTDKPATPIHIKAGGRDAKV